jgi:hypothetical protein
MKDFSGESVQDGAGSGIFSSYYFYYYPLFRFEESNRAGG